MTEHHLRNSAYVPPTLLIVSLRAVETTTFIFIIAKYTEGFTDPC